MAMQAVGMSFSKIVLLSGAAYTASIMATNGQLADILGRLQDSVWNYVDVQCTTAMQTSTRGLSSKDNKGTSSSLEADSCIMVAEHELEMQESKGSTS
ncbi:hypothetical protein Syun_009980 [Stephania yunnanensis]|uniref:Uncharacterized protein n=1 Tax=Stephania yunnanensis TaxID=152371 RepID=A0AAP0KFI8_9MAGN